MEAQVNVETVILTLPARMAEAVSALRENMDTLNPKVSLGLGGQVGGVGWASGWLGGSHVTHMSLHT